MCANVAAQLWAATATDAIPCQNNQLRPRMSVKLTIEAARLKNGFFANLGPGGMTGAADDDPSGISTYSVTGASFGYTPLWTVLFSFPLMAAVRMMWARLGMVSGRGLAGVIRRRYPRWVLDLRG